MRIYDLIAKKRDGGTHTREELEAIVNGFVSGEVADYQMAAWMMAVYLRGMTNEETAELTDVMAHSGVMVDLSPIPGIKVDKHSTGGVGDKTTLVIAPVVAACGVKIAKMSGRGLGHTGGTIDKMESVPGTRTALSQEEFFAQVNKIGLSVIGQSEGIAVADKKMYALRDVTATVSCIPLIASSIVSKKLASGAGAIVLDVKTGSGALMHTLEDSIALAKAMVDIGAQAGKKLRIDNADAENVESAVEMLDRIGNGEIFIDFVAPDTRINDIQLGIPVSINIENGVAAMALAHLNGVTDEEIKKGMASFRGVDRRFDFKLKNDRIVFLSDYAHHPSEIKQSVLSMRELYKDKKITAIFQPHLYTRTRDFYQDFADSLSLLDEVILVDIYPAREAPIPGITSKLIYDNLRPGIEKSMCKKEDILNILKDKNIEVLITLGAGDIDNYVPEICKILENR